MNKVFQYTLLKYNHSQLTGESFNIGILFYFPSINKFDFLARKEISILEYLYEDFPTEKIKVYLKAFKKAAGVISQKKEQSDFYKTISKHFLVKESNTLQFSEIKSALLYTDDVKSIVEQYFDIYFTQSKKGKSKKKSLRHS